MALKMPGPVALAPHHVFHLNIRVPRDLLGKVRGTFVALPVDGEQVTVKIGDKVLVSLRTKVAREARTRFSAAFAALEAHWKAMREAPKPLTHKQFVALSGDVYRRMVQGDDEPGDFAAMAQAHEEAIVAFRDHDLDDLDVPSEHGRPLGEVSAEFLAELQLPYGPQLLTWRHGGDLVTPFFTMSYCAVPLIALHRRSSLAKIALLVAVH